jgi:4-hydroxybenzoate polyprenyltransferase
MHRGKIGLASLSVMTAGYRATSLLPPSSQRIYLIHESYMQTRSKTLDEVIDFVNQYLGWRNWAVFAYNSAIENIFPIFFIALHDRLFSWGFIADFFSFFLFSMFSTTYGYLVNDLSDRDLDRSHRKSNTFEDDSIWKATLIVILFLFLSAPFGIRFVGKGLFLPIWLGWFLVTTCYSLKPIRLKERGKIGLTFVVLAQRVLPTLIVFEAFGHWDGITVFVFTLYIFFRGLSSDVNHQLDDYQNDAGTSTATFAVKTGIAKVKSLLCLSLEMEKVLLIFCLVLMYFRLDDMRVQNVSLILPILIGYIVVYGASFFYVKKGTSVDIVNPFACGRKSIFHFLHHTFPSVVLPLYLGILLLSKYSISITILIFFALYRKLYSVELIVNTFPFSIVKRLFVR